MQMQLAILVFLIAYLLIATEKFNRVAIALSGAAAMIVIGATDADAIFYDHDTGIDWNVIFLLLGMMIIVGVIHKTGLFEYLAIRAIKRAKGEPKRALVFLIILTAIASAILDNVTTILLAVPMTLVVCKQLNIIASRANLSFNDFLVHMAPWVIVVMMVITPMLIFMFRKELVNTAADRARIEKLDEKSYLRDKVLLKKSLFVLGAVMVAFVLHTALHLEPSIVAMLGAGVLVAISRLKPKDYAMDVEWATLVFFAGLFIMVGALVKTGALGEFAQFLKEQVGDQASLAAMVLLFVSAILSGIVDNIPYVASMSPVVTELSAGISQQYGDVLWWALAFGADFGGNATIIGASANVVAIGLAHKAGIKISFWQFAKYGIPVTLVSVAMVAPYILIRYF